MSEWGNRGVSASFDEWSIHTPIPPFTHSPIHSLTSVGAATMDTRVLLTNLLQSGFSANSRIKGDRYADAGYVRIVRATPDEVQAIVSGTEEYRVQITRSGSTAVTVTASCECPYFFDQSQPCKHIWATLRIAERKSVFTGATGVTATSAMLELVDLDAPDIDEIEREIDDEIANEIAAHGLRPGLRSRSWVQADPPKPPDPAEGLVAALRTAGHDAAPAVPFRYDGGQLLYVFDLPTTLAGSGDLVLEVMWRKRRQNGEWGVPKSAKIAAAELHHYADADREVLERIAGATPAAAPTWTMFAPAPETRASWFTIPQATLHSLVRLMTSTGRAYVRYAAGRNLVEIAWDAGPPWTFRPLITTELAGVRVDGVFERAGDQQPVTEPLLVLSRGLIFSRGVSARLEFDCDFTLIAALRRSGPVDVPPARQSGLIEGLARSGVPADQLPETLRVETVSLVPHPRLSLRRSNLTAARLAADVSFDYDGFVQPTGGAAVVFDAERRRMITRAPDAESAAVDRLSGLGFAPYPDYFSRATAWEIATHQLMPVVRTLTSEGWHVSAEGRLYRPPRRVSMSVTSGIDWFDLTATVEFDNETIPLGDVLAALKRREVMVRLGDGTVGLLPDDWLRRYGPLAATGEVTADGLRFRPSQAALLDVLLEAQAEHSAVTMDEAFDRARQQLRGFDRIRDAAPPASFTGTLRPYQREGLGWLQFLRQFSFGGCLADDMGLGKTIMVLALLDGIRAETAAGADRRPSLVIVPRSLVHNWHSEAARFAPALRVLDYSGAGRGQLTREVNDADIVLSTYGTLRRDVEALRTMEFEYVILDESQAIKNASTVAAKAVRLLRARHRLALSGTPIENHIGELWSLFDFLNPGLLGASSAFQGAAGAIRPDADTLATMARGLRPFILRRTKEQVASDLPARTEHTLVCDLEPKQRTFYDSLRAHYQQSLLARVERDGLSKSKMHILEALLRLRQAACHPGLVDPKREGEASAKLDLLVPRLVEIAESGHKALVFSQFTSFLALLRRRLDAAGLTYEYLDGRVRDRKGRVERFQTDAACPLFLISLKAGGVGLNLTAAGYVFLLDPWWNPAAEAQAIDRAHRIGQTREVFAYRLIAQNTIEEKVVELQRSKRALADAILSADAGGIKGITREELAVLLS